MNSSELEKRGEERFGGLERERGRDRGRKALSYAIQLHSLGLLVNSPCACVCACVSFNMNLLRLPNI